MHLYTVKKADVGKAYFKVGNKQYTTIGLCGPFQEIDIGKRIYLVNGVTQIESQEQLERRIKNEPGRQND